MKLLTLLIFINFTCFAQTITNFEYQVVDRNGYSCKAHLLQQGIENIFIIDDKRTEASVQSTINPGEYYRVHNDKWSKIFYFDGKNTITRVPLYDKDVIYNSTEITKNIVFTEKKKKVGKFLAQEAIVEKGGRKYSVYFTKEYPNFVGPMGFNFLPGLVVEVKDLEDNINYIQLLRITKENENKNFEIYKKFIQSKKIQTYEAYTKHIVQFLTNKKRDNFALLAKHGATIEYAADESFYTDHLVDIPANLVKELKKIKQ